MTEEGTGFKGPPDLLEEIKTVFSEVFRSAGMDGEGPLQDLVEGGKKGGETDSEMEIKGL